MTINWINLPGLANLRDVAGRTTDDGHEIRPNRLLRSDNLQNLPERTVRALVDEHNVTDVIDLRRPDERENEGPASLDDEPVAFHRISLYGANEADETGVPDTDAARARVDEHELADLLGSRGEFDEHTTRLAAHYLVHYIRGKSDRIIAALRAIANAKGAALVHCAAGKDRTGTITALALSAVGVGRDQVLADYDATNARIERIMERLRAGNSYPETRHQDPSEQTTPAATMGLLLEGIDRQYGSVAKYLAAGGWTDDDQARLRRHLLAPAGGDLQ